MMKLLKNLFRAYFLLFVVSCSTIDDDLSDCGKEVAIDYEMYLITNKEHEITTVLGGEADQPMAEALRQHLSNIFTDYGNDLGLSFYETTGDSLRIHHEQQIMNATEKSYTIYLPVKEYQHLAVANIDKEPQVTLYGDDHCHPACLIQQDADTVVSQNTGIYTARLPMQVMDKQDQDFHVRLYMANCGSAIVLDTTLCDYRSIRIYTTGFATGYRLCDSTYQHPTTVADAPMIRANRVAVSEGSDVCYCSVNFPSPEPPDTRTITETTEPFIASSADEDLWQYRCYITLTNGSVTESILGIKKPLRAGQLKIIKGRVRPDGGIDVTSDADVGVSVSLDWKPGGNYEPVL